MLAENRIFKIKQLLNKQKYSQVTHASPLFWKPEKLINRITSNKDIQHWLNTQGSLTTRLRQLCPALEVVILSEKLERPLINEAQSLGLQSHELAWIRCVLLKGGEENWVYARTVIPHFLEPNPWTHLQQLGNKPLGEVLFQDNTVQRTSFTFARQPLTIWPYLPISPNQQNNSIGYARRSIFTQQKAPLLLTEVFLPSLLIGV
ncbi:Chorismate--pyruvate lyase [hydrothermal vent metagenome]|uniref:Chorismate--pyruvate lyase n=1 Tax=hydrothermal vent metagenome TaxID=652676 RepID=A0A3B0W905_9ZZZZ